MLTIPTDRRQEGLPADMLHAVRPCRFATHRLSYRRAAAGHALWLRNYWSALRKMPLVAFEGAGCGRCPCFDLCCMWMVSPGLGRRTRRPSFQVTTSAIRLLGAECSCSRLNLLQEALRRGFWNEFRL